MPTLVTVIQMRLRGACSVSGTMNARDAVITGKVPVPEEHKDPVETDTG